MGQVRPRDSGRLQGSRKFEIAEGYCSAAAALIFDAIATVCA